MGKEGGLFFQPLRFFNLSAKTYRLMPEPNL